MPQNWPGECDSLKESIPDLRVARILGLLVVCHIPSLALPRNHGVLWGPWDSVWVLASLGTEEIGPTPPMGTSFIQALLSSTVCLIISFNPYNNLCNIYILKFIYFLGGGGEH